MQFQAVIFDLGGVVLDSPLAEFRRFEQESGLPELFLGRVVMGSGPDGAWAKLERGELSLAEFCAAFEQDAEAAGARIDASELMRRIGAAMKVRPVMLGAIRELGAHGLKTAALTNNWRHDDTADAKMAELGRAFDVVIESCRVGLRKPDPAIYELACRELGVPAQKVVFLDDLGHNLKPARALGMATIKVSDPTAALEQLSGLVGINLSVPAK